MFKMEPNGKNRVGIQYRLVVKCIDSGINLRFSLSCAVFIRFLKESWPTLCSSISGGLPFPLFLKA